jgi:hypothetical protein
MTPQNGTTRRILRRRDSHHRTRAREFASPLDAVPNTPDHSGTGGQQPNPAAWFPTGVADPAAGPRFDDTVAVPIDAAQRLEEFIRDGGRALRAMPPPTHLSSRMLSHRAHLQRVLREAASARVRLARGTYGTCTTCAGPISLAYLRRRPWTPCCIYCDLDI